MPQTYRIVNYALALFTLATVLLLTPTIANGQVGAEDIVANSTLTKQIVAYPPDDTIQLVIPSKDYGAGLVQGKVQAQYYKQNFFTGLLSVTSNGTDNDQVMTTASYEQVMIATFPGIHLTSPYATLRITHDLAGSITYLGLQGAYFQNDVLFNWPGGGGYDVGKSLITGQHQRFVTTVDGKVSFIPVNTKIELTSIWRLEANMAGGGGTGHTQAVTGAGSVTLESLTTGTYLTHYSQATSGPAGDFLYPSAHPQLQAFVLAPTAPTGGLPLTGYLYLTGPAPTGGLAFTLTSSNSTVASLPASVTIPAGQAWSSFPINTAVISKFASALVSLVVRNSAGVALIKLNVHIYAALPTTLGINPSAVTGGTTATGTVTLNSPAPVGGLTVTLSSDTPLVAKVPKTIRVPAGATSASFSVTTYPVATGTTTKVTISGQYGPAIMSAPLTVSN